MATVDFFDTSTHFPILERVSITFTRSNWYWRPKMITPPRAQEMNVFAPDPEKGSPISPILEITKPPSITSLCLQIPPLMPGSSRSFIPTQSVGEYLPNLTDLPGLQAIMDKAWIRRQLMSYSEILDQCSATSPLADSGHIAEIGGFGALSHSTPCGS